MVQSNVNNRHNQMYMSTRHFLKISYADATLTKRQRNCTPYSAVQNWE